MRFTFLILIFVGLCWSQSICDLNGVYMVTRVTKFDVETYTAYVCIGNVLQYPRYYYIGLESTNDITKNTYTIGVARTMKIRSTISGTIKMLNSDETSPYNSYPISINCSGSSTSMYMDNKEYSINKISLVYPILNIHPISSELNLYIYKYIFTYIFKVMMVIHIVSNHIKHSIQQH